MRTIASLLLLLLVVLPAPAGEPTAKAGRFSDASLDKSTESSVQSHWRYTVNGWEDVRTWHSRPLGPAIAPALHPIVVGLLELLLASFLLLAFSDPQGAFENRDSTAPPLPMGDAGHKTAG